MNNEQAKAAPAPDLPEYMDETSEKWFHEAAVKEEQANELRREELRLRVEIVGLRAAAQGIRAAMKERAEYAERMQSVVHQEQDQDGAEDSQDPRPLPRQKYAR